MCSTPARSRRLISVAATALNLLDGMASAGATDRSRATGPGRLQPVKNGDVTRGIGSNSATANQSAVGARVRDFVLVMYAFLSGVLA
jgi:hypothetical protein